MYTREELVQISSQYQTRNEFREGDRKAYDSARHKKILNLICSHMKAVFIYWTDDSLWQEALKYSTRGKFKKGHRTAYELAWGRGILDQICGHMVRARIENWTTRGIETEALKYATRSDFVRNSTSAYQAAIRLKILNSVCSHMKSSRGSSGGEIELFDLIKSLYPSTQKFRDRNVKIKGKPHIKGFDIDIYVPELNKGIEFDGRWYHSFEGSKRARPNWPDEDIKNYHPLKDSWFAKKDIKILHIEEENWIKNKIDCIKKCVEFLK